VGGHGHKFLQHISLAFLVAFTGYDSNRTVFARS